MQEAKGLKPKCIWDKSMDYLFAAAQGRVNGYGQFRALKYDKETGAFAETSRFMARTWDEPRHAAVHPNNRWVIVATLQGGTLYSIERNGDGSLGKIVSAFTYEGKEPGKVSTIHQCIWDRSMDYLFAAAQGRVNGYGQFRALKYDKETGAFAETSRFMARTWDEPRHAAVHPNNRWGQ